MEQHKGFTIGNWISEGKRIGKGAFATVFLGYHRDRPTVPVAIKVVDVERLTRSNQKLKKHLDSEISIMRSLRHDNIVTLHEVFVGTEYIYLILEYCEGGDFSDYLKKHKRLSEDTARYFLRQLAAGLKYLHSRNIVHRDLKPQNLLLAKSSSPHGGIDWTLKIADFGFARFIEPQSVASTLCGSPLYMAPEVLLCKPYDAKADLWSVGAILYEMLTGSPPFNVRTHIELVRIIVSESVKFPRDLGVSSECMDLLQSLLNKNKEDRITWREFFSHPFIVQQDTPVAPISFRSSDPRAIPNNSTSSGHRFGHFEKRSATIGSAPTNVGNLMPPSPPMAVGSPIAASLPLHRMDNNFISPPRQQLPHAAMAGHYTFLSPSSLPHNLSSSPSGGGGSYPSPPFAGSPVYGSSPTFSPSSSPTSMYVRPAGSDPNSAYARSPNSSGGFGEGFGSGGWSSGPRKPLTNPFKESTSPHPSLIRSKEKESIGSADDSFELLESTSDSTSSSQLSREERQAVDELEGQVRRAATVVELADSKVDINPAEALGLYIKALQKYHSISQRAKNVTQAQSLTASSRLGVVVERMKAEFNATLRKAEYLKRNLKPYDTCPPAEKSIYDSALQMGRDGAVAEVLRNFGKAESLYVRSTQLLQLLANDANHASDKAVLDSYIASFEKRLTEVRKKLTDENVAATSLTVTSE